MIQDVAPLMELEKMNVGNNAGEKLGHSMDWTSYHPLEDMYGWFDYLETTFDFVETESIGQTFEGQEMVVLKVNAKSTSFSKMLSRQPQRNF